jgi:hypothetical protein
MGLWHGPELHYIAYGFYQAVLLSAFHIFSRWTKMHRYWRDGVVWRLAATFITFQCVCFGLLIFSGRIGAAPLPHFASKIDRADCTAISGWVWDKNDADAEVHVELWDRDRYVMAFAANRFREDLIDAGYGNGRHAFRIPTPPQLTDQRPHVIHLRVAGTTQELTDSTRVIRCP